MKKSHCAALFGLCLALLFGPVTALANPPENTPRFTWSAFQRFWGKGATPHVLLHNPRQVEDGYIVDYGYTTKLKVHMDGKAVIGVDITFVGGKDNDAGGPQFLRLIHHAITVGTFRWPQEEVEKIRRHFAVMSPAPVEYSYQATHFERGHDPRSGWFFCFHYIPDVQHPNGRADIPQ